MKGLVFVAPFIPCANDVKLFFVMGAVPAHKFIIPYFLFRFNRNIAGEEKSRKVLSKFAVSHGGTKAPPYGSRKDLPNVCRGR